MGNGVFLSVVLLLLVLIGLCRTGPDSPRWCVGVKRCFGAGRSDGWAGYRDGGPPLFIVLGLCLPQPGCGFIGSNQLHGNKTIILY